MGGVSVWFPSTLSALPKSGPRERPASCRSCEARTTGMKPVAPWQDVIVLRSRNEDNSALSSLILREFNLGRRQNELVLPLRRRAELQLLDAPAVVLERAAERRLAG